MDLHYLLLAGLPAHFESSHPSQAVGSPSVVIQWTPLLNLLFYELLDSLHCLKATGVAFIERDR